MMAIDKNAVICDLAETYGIFCYRELPALTVATLAAGLREDSRIKMKLSGQRVPLMIQLLAIIADRLSTSTDESKSIYLQLTKPEDTDKGEIQTFATPEEFEEAYKRALGRR